LNPAKSSDKKDEGIRYLLKQFTLMFWGSTSFRQLLCGMVYCLSFTITSAQLVSHENFTVKDGLSENIVHCLLQDKKGFIWIGTHEGLNRYDGYGFKKFLYNKNDSASLPNSPIESLYEDEDGNLLVRTTSGLTRMNTLTGKFTFVKDGLTDFVTVVNQFFDPARDFDMYDFGIDPFWSYQKKNNPDQVLRFTLKKDLHSYSTSLAFYYDDLKRLWVLRPDRLLVVDEEGNERTVLTGFLINDKDKKVFNWFITDANGNIWLRASGKLFCIDKKTLLVKIIVDQNQLKELAIESISTLLLDKSGILWIGSFYGLKKLNLTPQKFKHIIHNEKGLVSNFVLGLNLYAGNRLTVQHYFLDSFYTEIELPVMRIRQHRIEDRSVEKLLNEVLIRNSNRGSPLVRNNQIQKLRNSNYDWKMFRYAHTDSEGTIWSFFNRGRLINFNDDRSVGYEGTAEHLWDDDKFLWIATAKQGLIRYHKHTGEVRNYKTDKNNRASISTDEVICLFPDAKGNLWIGTRGGGLNYFDKEKEIFTTYTQTNGLSNNTIYCMVMDDENNLWMGTANGLSCFDTGSRTFQNFYTSDGLINTEFNRWSAIKDTQGNLYFGGMHGIDYFDPADVLLQQTNIPTVQLTDFKIGNRSLPIEPGTILQYKDNFLSFEFATMDFRNPSATKYEYMLEGANTDWIKADQNRTVTFTSLSPGKYTFKVKCSTQNGQWSNEAILPFIIKTPWWQARWFYALCGLLIAGTLYGIYRFRVNQLKKLYAIRSKISRDLHDEVGATLSSIHIYSSVASKAMNADAGKAQDALQQINVNARQVMENMNDIVWAMHTGTKGEITFENKLKNYGYELLTPLNITCAYHIDTDAEKLLTNIEARKNILLITKEAINNIAKHSGATQASINLKVTGKDLQLEIHDNGKGLETKRNGNGFQNMKNRTEALGGHFNFSGNGNGTHIQCMIPITSIRD
jgi:ligand-binding sensor domain-containing protein